MKCWKLLLVAWIIAGTTGKKYDHELEDAAFGKFFQPVANDPRPENEPIPKDLRMAPEEAEPPPRLDCGDRVKVYDGDKYLVQSNGYPAVSSPNDKCQWELQVQENVGIDLICEKIHLPCSYWNYMYFLFSFAKKKPSKFCTGDVEKVYTDQELRIKTYEEPYSLKLAFGSKDKGNGEGFSCTVKGSGGATRPDAFELGELNDQEYDQVGEDPSLPCPKNVKRRKVVGGVKAADNEFPWMVALIVGTTNLCGGSLISDRWILTAGHCVVSQPASQIVIRMGCTDRTSKSDCLTENHVDLVILHPDYRFPRNDIALLRLSERVKFSSAVQPICLPSVQVGRDDGADAAKGKSTKNGKTKRREYRMIVAGWGKVKNKGGVSKVLRKAVVSTAPVKKCRRVYGKRRFSNETNICANGVTGSSCQGDSGSFVGARRRRRMEINGIVSYGAKDACDKFPMGLTNIYVYKQWIVGVKEKYDDYVV